MNVRLRLALLGSLMLATSVVRCGGTTQSGSESHFLGECAASSECEQGLECECGICTRSCAADAECESLAMAARCIRHLGCETAICDFSCASAAECAVLGSAFQCRAGACREPAGERTLCSVGTSDIGDRADAEGICGDSQNCTICVETVSAEGRPLTYFVAEEECACQTPTVVDAGAPATDGSASQVDGAPDAGRPFCVQFCGSDFVADPIFDATGWRCPDGFVDVSSCPSIDGGAGCSTDPECSDGNFCNGAEVCSADHTCQAGTPPADGTFCGQDRICQAGGCVVAPSPTEWTQCTDEACLCDGLAACAPVERQVALPLGSVGQRVCGVQGDQCIVSAYDETEGGVTVLRCEVPLGDSCVDGVTLAAGSPYCESVLSCNVLMQSCPADLLACPSVAPPTCSAVDPNAFGDCTLALGYAFDGTGCVPVSGCGCDPSCDSFFATRDECWAGCSRSCTDVVAARRDFYEENDHCTTDADCMWVESGGPPYEHCSCIVAVNRNIDIGVWRALNLSYGCFEQGTCCDADPPPIPICSAGRCEPGSG